VEIVCLALSLSVRCFPNHDYHCAYNFILFLMHFMRSTQHMSGALLPHHDDGAVSSSSEDHSLLPEQQRRARRHAPTRRTGGGAITEGATAPTPSDREHQLTELLARASDAIRKEREKVASLESETQHLREQITQLLSNPSAAALPAPITSSGPPQQQLRKKLQDLALDHFIALEEINRLRGRVHELEMDAALEVVVVSPIKSPLVQKKSTLTPQQEQQRRRSHSAAEATLVSNVRRATVTIVGSPRQQRGQQRQHMDPMNPAATRTLHQNASATGDRIPPEHHSFDAMRSVQQQHQHSNHPSTSSPNRRGTFPTSAAPLTPTSAKKKQSDAAQRYHSTAVDLVTAIHTTPSLGKENSKSKSSSSPPPTVVANNYNDVMIHRLRRALAPQPTKEQLGEVVHAMVVEMGKQLKLRGALLNMKKLDHGVYNVNDKKKIHLTIDSGRLVVKCGGGHVDFLEFLERNRLCTKVQIE
jgi:hypothetical protein